MTWPSSIGRIGCASSRSCESLVAHCVATIPTKYPPALEVLLQPLAAGPNGTSCAFEGAIRFHYQEPAGDRDGDHQSGRRWRRGWVRLARRRLLGVQGRDGTPHDREGRPRHRGQTPRLRCGKWLVRAALDARGVDWPRTDATKTALISGQTTGTYGSE